jgi:RNA polymerase sigma factor (sigma-70 family)
MTSASEKTLLPFLRQLAPPGDADGATDRQLLEWFITHRQEAAFRALVDRHGPMVMGVCRRVLQNAHDAEDAFQATFLVLARKAASVVPRELVANWLYGVAYRTARKARVARTRADAVKRRMYDRVTAMAARTRSEDEIWHDLQPVLDQELQRLPDKYRVAVVLCDLEGKPRKEAALQLGWPEGTLSGRLARARKLLAGRLTGRGVTLSVAALTAALAKGGVSAAVPGVLKSNVTRAALFSAGGKALPAGIVSATVSDLTEGVMRAMRMARLRVGALLVIAFGLVAAGTVLAAQRVAAGMHRQSESAEVGPAKLDQVEATAAETKIVGAEMHVIGLNGPKGLHGNNKRVDVEVRPIAKPVVLVLTSFLTVDWHLRLAPGVRIRQIILGGAYEQTIEGVPAGVPVICRFPKNLTDSSTPGFWAYDPKTPEYRETVRKLNAMTGLPVASFQCELEGTFLVVDGVRGSRLAQKGLPPAAVPLLEMKPDQIRAAAAGGELHVLAFNDTRDPSTPVDVEVRKTDRPAVLALTSFHMRGSAIWKVKLAEGARVKLVILGGFGSEVEGLPPGVPVADHRRFPTVLLGPQFPVRYPVSRPGYLFAGYQPHTFAYRRMMENLMSMTALSVTSFQGKKIGDSFVIDGVNGREFERIEPTHRTLKPHELLAAAKGCELHVVGLGISGDGHKEPMVVEVRPTAKPVVLVLTSRQFLLWKLKLAEKARLRAVILGGDYEQDIEGVPADIPVIHRTGYPDENLDRRNEGYFFASFHDSVAYREMERILNELTGLPVASLQTGLDGSWVVDGVRGSQFAQKEVTPHPIRHASLTPGQLLSAAAGCELHYVSVLAPGGGQTRAEFLPVEVGETEKPALIVLASHDPVIWKFKLAKKARVKAVILGASVRPEIDGLPAEVPVVDCSVVSSSFPTARPKLPWSELWSLDPGSLRHRRALQKLNAMTGLPIATCQTERWATAFVIDGIRGRELGKNTIEPPPPTWKSLKPDELLAAAAGAELHVVGIYGSAVGSAGEQISRDTGGVVEVEVRPTDKPIVLTLTSWDPVAWKLKMADRARIKAIILGGPHENEIEGMRVEVPVIVLPRDRIISPHQYNSPEFRGLSRVLRTLTGLPVSTFQEQDADYGVSFVIDGTRGRNFARRASADAR